MAARMLTVVCAWCNRTMTAAATGAPVTHSICPPCLEWSIAHRRRSSTICRRSLSAISIRVMARSRAGVERGDTLNVTTADDCFMKLAASQ